MKFKNVTKPAGIPAPTQRTWSFPHCKKLAIVGLDFVMAQKKIMRKIFPARIILQHFVTHAIHGL